MSVDEAYRIVGEGLPYQRGAFYGACDHLSLGAGLIFANLRQPAFDELRYIYRTVRALSYVVTHECDVDQGNRRPFNDSVLVCPIIPLEAFIVGAGSTPNLPGFLRELAKRRVLRVMYLPTLPAFQYGGLMYLNRITWTHVDSFSDPRVRRVGAVSAVGLREVDSALQNLLLREKSDVLWGMRGA